MKYLLITILFFSCKNAVQRKAQDCPDVVLHADSTMTLQQIEKLFDSLPNCGGAIKFGPGEYRRAKFYDVNSYGLQDTNDSAAFAEMMKDMPSSGLDGGNVDPFHYDPGDYVRFGRADTGIWKFKNSNSEWENIFPSGRDTIVFRKNGVGHYLEFGKITKGGYGRPDTGKLEYKNSGGKWITLGDKSDTVLRNSPPPNPDIEGMTIHPLNYAKHDTIKQ